MFIAHPNDPLKIHLLDISDRIKILQKYGVLYDIGEIIEFSGLFHDFGKYSNIFQMYLRNATGEITITDSSKLNEIEQWKNHSALGAIAFLYFYYENKNIFEDAVNSHSNNYNSDEIKKYVLMCSIAILKHHSDIDFITDIKYLYKGNDSVYSKCLHQLINYISDEAIIEFKTILPKNSVFSKEGMIQFLENEILGKDMYLLLKKTYGEQKTIKKDVFIFKCIYSFLIHADKFGTIFNGKDIEKSTVDKDVLNRYRENKGFDKNNGTGDLNSLRYEIYKEVNDNIFAGEKKIKVLNSPTGSGKTHNLLNIGLTIKDRNKKMGVDSKIIYAIPMVSIIDQVYSELENIMNFSIPNSSGILGKHHHLGGIIDNQRGELTYNEEKYLLESWENEITVTTFHQLFNSLFFNKNKLLVKIPNLVNSIIILDEIQIIRHEYWKEIRDMLGLICDVLGATVIISSATIPKIIEGGNCDYLIKSPEKYFEHPSVKRTIIDFKSYNKKYSTDELAGEIIEKMKNNEKKNILVCLNTIKSSKEVAKIISENISVNDKIFYLSTNLIPKDREEILKSIKETMKTGTHRVVLVSTQLIEAGVDIDFDIGFRDFAPIDQIIQFSGRINRNGLRRESEVFITTNLCDKSGKKYYSYIYPGIKSDISKNLIVDLVFKEQDYRDLAEKFYENINMRSDFRESAEINACWENRDIEGVSNKFELIKDNRDMVNIFIEKDDYSIELNKKYKEVKFIKDKFKKKEAWNKIKGEFMKYVISKSFKEVQGLFNASSKADNIKEEFIFISNTDFMCYYDDFFGWTGGTNALGDENFI